MSPEQLAEFNKMKEQLAMYERFFEVSANRIVLKNTVIVDGVLNADRVYTQRSGSYVELTS